MKNIYSQKNLLNKDIFEKIEILIKKIILIGIMGFLIPGCSHIGKEDQTKITNDDPIIVKDWLKATVQITSKIQNTHKKNGFGFIVGEKHGKLYILTANHVLYNNNLPNNQNKPNPLPQIEVEFSDNKGVTYNAEALKKISHGDLDVALLRIDKPSYFTWKPGIFCRQYRRNEHVWFIGPGQNLDLYIPPIGHVPTLNHGSDSSINNHIELTTNLILQGTSGAPLITNKGLIGMIIRGGGLGNSAKGVEIGALQNFLKRTAPEYPWGLSSCDIKNREYLDASWKKDDEHNHLLDVEDMRFYVNRINKLSETNASANSCWYQIVISLENRGTKKISGHASGHPTIFLTTKRNEEEWISSVKAETIGFGTVGKPATTLLPKQIIEFQINTKSQEPCDTLHLGVKESFGFFAGPHVNLNFRRLEPERR